MAGGQESIDERLARELVTAQLGCAVEAYDDGSADGMPDGRITYPDGRTGWLEVVTDRDTDHEAQRATARELGPLRVAELGWSWSVTLRPDVRLKGIKQWLTPLLMHVEATVSVGSDAVNDMVQRLDGRVLHAFGSPGLGCGIVSLFPGPTFASTRGAAELVEWLDAFFERHGDVATKMKRAGPADERHAFIWVTESSHAAWGTASGGTWDMNIPLPEDRPRLPAGVSHLWVAGVMNHDRCVAWFPDSGWQEIAAHWTRTLTGGAIAWNLLRADRRLALPPDEFWSSSASP